MKDLVAKINHILRKEVQYKLADPRQGDVKHSFANIGKANQFIDYQPKVGFEEGLKTTINSFQKYESNK